MFTIEDDKVLRDGEVIGTLKDGVVTLSVTLAPAHKAKLKKELGESGVEITGFAKAVSDDEETHETGGEKKACPVPRDPTLGDKTPAVIDWFRENDPEEYERRYVSRNRLPANA